MPEKPESTPDSAEEPKTTKDADGEPKITKDADGNECVGDDCIRMVFPKDSQEITMDLTECDPEIQKRVAQRITAGGGTSFDVRPKVEEKKVKKKKVEKKKDSVVEEASGVADKS